MARNIVATIPKTKFKDWATAERVCSMCDGTTNRKSTGYPENEQHEDEGSPWFWLINTTNLPKHTGEDSVCFMVFDGRIRGYFDIVDTDKSENWRSRHAIGKKRETQCVVMANWHPGDYGPRPGTQGWGYIDLQP
jgi:hypothetical protein